jgi:hypothetical protein
MGTPRYPKDMATEWQALRRKVSNTFTSSNSRVGTESIARKIVNVFSGLIINAGAFLKSLYSNGNDAFYIGEYDYDGTVEGIYMNRPNGAPVMKVWADGAVDGFWSFFDKQGNLVMADDDIAGEGLALPLFPYNWVRTSTLTTPVDTNSTTTYVPHYTVWDNAQNPQFSMRLYVQCTGTAKAKIRLHDTFFGAYFYESPELDTGFQVLDCPHNIFSAGIEFIYDIEVKVSSGTGSVGITVMNLQGFPSPF